MSLLWYGGEDSGVISGSPRTVSSAGYFRAGYARATTACYGLTYFSAFTGGAITSCWFSCQYYPTSTSSTNLGQVGLVKSGTGGKGFWIGTGASTAKWALLKYDGSSFTVLASESGATMLNSQVQRLDLNLVSYGASTTASFYSNGGLLISYSGNPTVAGVTDLDQVALAGTGSAYGYASEIIVATDDCRTWSVVTHYPSGAGTSNDWTNDYSAIDEAVLDTGDIIYSNTNGQTHLSALSNLPAGSFIIKGVKVEAKACKGGSGITKVGLGIRSGSTTDTDTAHALTTAWTTEVREMTVNPVTTNAFSQSEIDAMQLAFLSAT